LADSVCRGGFGRVGQAVIDSDPGYLPDHGEYVSEFIRYLPRLQVDVPGGPPRAICGQQHSALENELGGMPRNSKPRQESFQGVETHQVIGAAPCFSR
jgi:hypothetical protein